MCINNLYVCVFACDEKEQVCTCERDREGEGERERENESGLQKCVCFIHHAYIL